MHEYSFIRNLLSSPRTVGAVLPSSAFVAKRLIKHIPVNTTHVVEFGPGTGAITLPLLKNLKLMKKLEVIEKNHSFAEVLRKVNDSRLKIIEGTVTEHTNTCRDADVILSGLPFRCFSEYERNKIVKATAASMPKTSIFIVYLQYTRILEPVLKRYFRRVTHDFEWRNIPPTHFFICKNPIDTGADHAEKNTGKDLTLVN